MPAVVAAAVTSRESSEGGSSASPASSSGSSAQTRQATQIVRLASTTPAETEGPFFTSGSPERANLREAGIDGTPLVVAGTVMSTDCTPIAGAKLDFWHADDDGDYDNEGYHLRGHQFADDQGGYRLETIVPAIYQGRTRHIHVKVQPAGKSILTTQMYFPGEPENDSDSLYDDALLMSVNQDGDGKSATFDFVVEG